MDFYSAQQFFANLFPGKKISYHFDKLCLRQLECVFTDGMPNVYHHVEFNKVKVDVEGMASQYIPIDSHRANISWASFKDVISEVTNVNVTENFLSAFASDSTPDEKVAARAELQALTGLSDKIINEKIQKVQDEAINGKAALAPPVPITVSL